MPGLHANSVASTFQRSFGTSMIAGGIILCVFLAVVVFGGVKRIGEFSEKAAPIMCLIYMLMAIGIVVIYYKNIPGVIGTIISSAFGQNAVYGGILGSAIAWGVKRGVYSTEAGQGSGRYRFCGGRGQPSGKTGISPGPVCIYRFFCGLYIYGSDTAAE